MTTPWKIAPAWAGATVAVLASGPSMSRAVADDLRRHRCIAVNHEHRRAPWADMMVAMDLNLPLWHAARHFAGMKLCGVASDAIDALYVGSMHERVRLSPVHVIEINNSGLAAIRIAAAMGAARIILAGFDPDRAPAGKYVGLAQGLAALVKELTERGIAVERYAPLPPLPSVAGPGAKQPARARRKRSKAA